MLLLAFLLVLVNSQTFILPTLLMRKLSQTGLTVVWQLAVGGRAGVRAQCAGSGVPLSTPHPLLIVRHFRSQCVLCWGPWCVSSTPGPGGRPAPECAISSEPRLVSAWPQQRPGRTRPGRTLRAPRRAPRQLSRPLPVHLEAQRPV